MTKITAVTTTTATTMMMMMMMKQGDNDDNDNETNEDDVMAGGSRDLLRGSDSGSGSVTQCNVTRRMFHDQEMVDHFRKRWPPVWMVRPVSPPPPPPPTSPPPDLFPPSPPPAPRLSASSLLPLPYSFFSVPHLFLSLCFSPSHFFSPSVSFSIFCQ